MAAFKGLYCTGFFRDLVDFGTSEMGFFQIDIY
jgi:hypothetical protein